MAVGCVCGTICRNRTATQRVQIAYCLYKNTTDNEQHAHDFRIFFAEQLAEEIVARNTFVPVISQEEIPVDITDHDVRLKKIEGVGEVSRLDGQQIDRKFEGIFLPNAALERIKKWTLR